MLNRILVMMGEVWLRCFFVLQGWGLRLVFVTGGETPPLRTGLLVYVIEVRCIFSLPLEGKVDATKEQTDEVLQTVFADKR